MVQAGTVVTLVYRDGACLFPESVLHGLLGGAISPDLPQAWASFVRRGYAAGSGGPIRPIDIDYEQACEDDIAETVRGSMRLATWLTGRCPRMKF
jgi:hypothetical protein